MWYINVVVNMYEGSCTSVKNMRGETEGFRVRVNVHQWSVLSLYLFSVIMDEVTKELEGEVPRCMLFANDLVLVGENRKEVN